MKKELKFPEGFLWGTATSSYQVEGEIKCCNWSQDFPAGKACDYYQDYEKYFDIAKSLNQNVHRLSLEWSRIEPEEGKFDREAIEHYKKILISLRGRNIKTMVTLWHYTIPTWLAQKGGWTNFKTPDYFQRYTEFAAKELNDYVDFWITINEPTIFASFSYIFGAFPPKKKNDFIGCSKAVFNCARGHKKAYHAIKNTAPQAKVAMSENYTFAETFHNNSILEKLMVGIWDFLRNRMFLDYTKNEQDFIGLNFYFHDKMKATAQWPFVALCNDNKVVSDLGWDIYPKGIYEVIKKLKKYSLPIYITENGVADKEDKIRAEYIKSHLEWVHKAIEEGADVRSYLYWSLLDDFEWEWGFKAKFGLLEVDFDDLSYKIRPSAWEYAKICKENRIVISE